MAVANYTWRSIPSCKTDNHLLICLRILGQGVHLCMELPGRNIKVIYRQVPIDLLSDRGPWHLSNTKDTEKTYMYFSGAHFMFKELRVVKPCSITDMNLWCHWYGKIAFVTEMFKAQINPLKMIWFCYNMDFHKPSPSILRTSLHLHLCTSMNEIHAKKSSHMKVFFCLLFLMQCIQDRGVWGMFIHNRSHIEGVNQENESWFCQVSKHF